MKSFLGLSFWMLSIPLASRSSEVLALAFSMDFRKRGYGLAKRKLNKNDSPKKAF